MASKQRWIDLAEYGVYLGEQKFSDGKYRLVVLDMTNRADPARLSEIGFLPFKGSPRYETGIYYLQSEEQKLRPKALAAAFGIQECPIVEIEASEIDQVFRKKITEKFGMNLAAVTHQTKPLGFNFDGYLVSESPTGRHVSLGEGRFVAEQSPEGAMLDRAAFLRASTNEELRQCADGFVWTIRRGGKTHWKDLVRFAKTVYDIQEPSDEQMHHVQEAVEAAAYRQFAKQMSVPDENAFRLATDFYYGLPTARIRTSESVFLQQYSTPLPMAVVAQRLLCGNDDLSGKSVLEPTAGNGGLLNLLPKGAKLYASELDRNRLQALRETGHVQAELADATSVVFRNLFGVQDGFDYMVANPPFGQMPTPKAFDKLPSVRRLDYYIALRALEARKDQGRSVLIMGADGVLSDGELKGGTKSFLNYLYDHYEVHGLVELDGRMYSKQGSAYNVRMMVIGNKYPVPIRGKVPEKLNVLTSYDEVWAWSEHAIQQYKSILEQAKVDHKIPAQDTEISIDARSIAPLLPIFGDAALPTVVNHSSEQQTIESVETKAVEEKADSKLPSKEVWEMTRADWERALETSKSSGSLGQFTRRSANEAAARANRLEALNFGVIDLARQRMVEAQSGKVKLTPDELAEIEDRLNTSVKHKDVIKKAVLEGKVIPKEVLAEYPDLMPAPKERKVNEFQAPYQSASKVSEPTAMIPINMSGATYAALNTLESRFGQIDRYVAKKLHYDEEVLSRYFSPEQVDAIALAIKDVEEGRGIINADQTGIGKGRFVAAMLRYAKLNEKMPVFLTIKPELFTDIFRDIDDIGSRHLFKKLFIFNEGESVKKFGTENEILYRSTTTQERKKAIEGGCVESDVDMVLATYSQFMRAYHKNPKARLLTEIVSANGMLLLDEAHVASGASNLASAIGEAVSNSASVVYSSATPLKGISNFAIYNKIFPKSVDLKTLPDILKAGGETLQEAISANMARDGVLIRREHDYSKLTFHTHTPNEERRERNIELANSLSEIVSGLAFLSGDVSALVTDLNKDFKQHWEDIPDEDRQGTRMQASSMNFGSRLYSLNRQFLLGIKIEDAVDIALRDLSEGRKPVIAVENTGESLLKQVIARRAGVDYLEEELETLDELGEDITDEQKQRREELVTRINEAMRNVKLDSPPQYHELLEIMLDRIAVIKVRGRYGEVARRLPDSEEYLSAAESLRERIRAFPDLPLTPIDVIKKELQQRGFVMAEVSGRKTSIVPSELVHTTWDVKFHEKANAVANVAGFQNGKYDAIVITRSGSTGISLHATNRFEDSDIRQRNFIVLQKASNIAEFLQWLGRVNRKDQVIEPVITVLDSGLPAEMRLTMMHNAKLRKLSANTTSNRDNANVDGEDLDLLNDVGDQVALEWLAENPDMAAFLDITLPGADEFESGTRFSQECAYINKLMGRLMMVSVTQQETILKTLSGRFKDRVEELEQRGENPFKVDVYEWGAQVVREEELQSGVIRQSGSAFDEPVKIVTVKYEQLVHPVRSSKLLGMIRVGQDLYQASEVLDTEKGGIDAFQRRLTKLKDGWIRRQLPAKFRESDLPLATLLENNSVRYKK